MVLLVTGGRTAFAQTDGPTRQLWFEFIPTFFMQPRMPIDVELGRYRALNNERTVETSITPVVYFTGALQINQSFYITPSLGLKIGYVQQDRPSNTLEIRPFAGARLVIQLGRFQLSDYFRYEYRSLSYLGLSERRVSNRLRNRIRVLASINKPRVLDNTWYVKVDLETFSKFDRDIKERFEASLRTQIGIGYRLNFTWAGEFVYGIQDSRDTIDEDYKETENIFSFSLLYTILQ